MPFREQASVFVTASLVILFPFFSRNIASASITQRMCPLRQKQVSPILNQWQKSNKEKTDRYQLFGILAGGPVVQFTRLVPFVVGQIRALSLSKSWTVNSASEAILSKVRSSAYYSFSGDELKAVEQAIHEAVDAYRKRPIVLSLEPYQHEQEVRNDSGDAKKFQKELYKNIEQHTKKMTAAIVLSRLDNWCLYRSIRTKTPEVHAFINVVDEEEYQTQLNKCGSTSSSNKVPYGFLCLKLNSTANQNFARESLLAVLRMSHAREEPISLK